MASFVLHNPDSLGILGSLVNYVKGCALKQRDV